MSLKKGFHHLHVLDLTFLKMLSKYQGAYFICLNAALHQFIFVLISKGMKMPSYMKNNSWRNCIGSALFWKV